MFLFVSLSLGLLRFAVCLLKAILYAAVRVPYIIEEKNPDHQIRIHFMRLDRNSY